MHQLTRSGARLTRRYVMAVLGSAALGRPALISADHDGT